MQRDTRPQSSTPPDGVSSNVFPNKTLSNSVIPNEVIVQSRDARTETITPGHTNAEVALVPDKERGFWNIFWGVFTANAGMTVGICIIAFFILVALIGPLFITISPDVLTNDLGQAPSLHHLLGTTQEGQDVFSRIVNGARLSLLTSFTAAAGATVLAMVVGLVAGYCGGWVDDVLSLITNIFLILPGMPLAIVIASFAVHGTATIIVVLLVTGWSWGARVLRAQTLSMRNREFVTAARTTGEGLGRIVFAEILPNEIAIVASSFVGTFIYAALAEVALEFLGLGNTSIASWGTILYWAQQHNALLGGEWWEFVPAGLCVALLCTGLSCVNFGIDALANPALRTQSKWRQKFRKAVA